MSIAAWREKGRAEMGGAMTQVLVAGSSGTSGSSANLVQKTELYQIKQGYSYQGMSGDRQFHRKNSVNKSH